MCEEHEVFQVIHQTFSAAETQFSLYVWKKKSQSAFRLYESGKHSSNLVDKMVMAERRFAYIYDSRL